MTNKTNIKSATGKRGTRNTKLLIVAASIAVTLGGTLGFLGDQLAASANTAVADASSNITVVYAAPIATTTLVTVPTSTSTPAATTVTASDIPTNTPTNGPTPMATATHQSTAEPTLEPTATATVQPVVVVTQPRIIVRTRSSK